MKTVILIALIAAFCACGGRDRGEQTNSATTTTGPAAARTLNVAALTDRVWVMLESDWYTDGTGGPPFAAYARVMRFEPSGRFSWLGCQLIRTDGRVAISRGDGLVFFFGTWKAVGDHVEVEYVKVRETMHRRGSDHPYQRKVAARAELRGGVLMFEDGQFTKSIDPGTEDYHLVVNGVREWEDANLRKFFARH